MISNNTAASALNVAESKLSSPNSYFMVFTSAKTTETELSKLASKIGELNNQSDKSIESVEILPQLSAIKVKCSIRLSEIIKQINEVQSTHLVSNPAKVESDGGLRKDNLELESFGGLNLPDKSVLIFRGAMIDQANDSSVLSCDPDMDFLVAPKKLAEKIFWQVTNYYSNEVGNEELYCNDENLLGFGFYDLKNGNAMLVAFDYDLSVFGNLAFDDYVQALPESEKIQIQTSSVPHAYRANCLEYNEAFFNKPEIQACFNAHYD